MKEGWKEWLLFLSISFVWTGFWILKSGSQFSLVQGDPLLRFIESLYVLPIVTVLVQCLPMKWALQKSANYAPRHLWVIIQAYHLWLGLWVGFSTCPFFPVLWRLIGGSLLLAPILGILALAMLQKSQLLVRLAIAAQIMVVLLYGIAAVTVAEARQVLIIPLLFSVAVLVTLAARLRLEGPCERRI